MLQRLALRELARWKQRATRKPLLIDGARQVGKSWLVCWERGWSHRDSDMRLSFAERKRRESR